jgi:hypothetical protein
LHLTEPKALFNLLLARFHKEIFLSAILRRIQLIISEYKLPLYVTEGLKDHKGEGMWETLLHHSQNHAVSVILVFLEILVQLLDYIETLDHQLFALLLSLGEEVGAEDDLGVVDCEHLELVLGLIDCMLDLHFEDADVVFAICEFFFLIHEHPPAHLYLRNT